MCFVEVLRSYELANGENIKEYKLKSENLEVILCNFGATIMSIGHLLNDSFEEVTLCYRSYPELEKSCNRTYYGCIVGRFANRIAKGRFYNGFEEFQLDCNCGPNHLHGGNPGYHLRVWSSEILHSSDDSWCGVSFKLLSPHNESNYPSDLEIEVVYRLSHNNRLTLEYFVRNVGLYVTPINLTNHTYWNLMGDLKGNIFSHDLALCCTEYLPVDDTSTPMGRLGACEDHFDFTTRRNLGKSICALPFGIDHCFVVNCSISSAVEADATLLNSTIPVFKAATLSCEVASNLERVLTVYSTQPGLQVYTGNFLPFPSDNEHVRHNGVCLESQHFPDCVNQPITQYNCSYDVPSSAGCSGFNESNSLLNPGGVYYQQTIYELNYSTR